MLRYFFACNFWLVVAVALLVGKKDESPAGMSGYMLTIYGQGSLADYQFWGILVLCVAVAGLCAVAWLRSLRSGVPRFRPQGFEVVQAPAASDEAA
jgi:hypothetical protein